MTEPAAVLDRDTIVALRKLRGLSQLELARRVGLGTTSVSEYERGDRSIPLDVAVRLATALGVAGVLEELAAARAAGYCAGFDDGSRKRLGAASATVMAHVRRSRVEIRRSILEQLERELRGAGSVRSRL